MVHLTWATYVQHKLPQHKYRACVASTTTLTSVAETMSVDTMISSRDLATTTTCALGHSLPTAQQSASQLQDLPPELRDIIYTLAMPREDNLRLVCGLTGTAKALSQVSRNIRADATRFFFSQNSFLVTVGFSFTGPDIFKTDFRRLEHWAETWGALASPHILSLNLVCGGYESCRHRVTVEPRNAANPVRYGNSGCVNTDRVRESDMNEIGLAVFHGVEKQKFDFNRLMVFLTAMEDVLAEVTQALKNARVAEILSKLKS